MTLFEVVWSTICIGGGAIAGYRIAQIPGLVVGLVAGGGLMWLVGRIVDPHPNDWPACACGANQSAGFSLELGEPRTFAYRCKKCGSIYEFKKGATWSRVLADGSTQLLMTRRWPGRWKHAQVRLNDPADDHSQETT